jgi:hypothetical protein
MPVLGMAVACGSALKECFTEVSLINFWDCVVQEKAVGTNFAMRRFIPVAVTCLHEIEFSFTEKQCIGILHA